MPSYVMYCRKSSESEDRQVLSIESQIKELTELAGRLNIPIAEVLTESQSAKRQGRPVFSTMMKRVHRGEIKGIITWKLDRLSRNPMDGGMVISAFDEGYLTEIITPGNTFRNTSNDKVSMSIDLCMAKKYVDDLSDNVKRGNRTKLEKGWVPGRAPLGYLNEPQDRTIVPDPERFLLVRKMWDLLLQGLSPYKIRKIANDDWGLRTRRAKKTGNNPISQAEIYKIFANPFYYGLIRRKEGVFPGLHKKMITEDEYWRAQETLGRPGRPRPKVHDFAFTGLIRCGECGCMITAEEKNNRYGRHYVYYRCTKKKDGPHCRQRYVNVKDLEAQIIEYLDQLHVPDTFYDAMVDHLEERQREAKAKAALVRKSLEGALANCQKKLENLTHMRLKDLIDDEEYSAEKGKLVEEKISLEGRLKDDSGFNELDVARDTLDFANSSSTRFRKGSIQDKRSILMNIGSNFVLKDGKLLIDAKKPIITLERTLRAIKEKNGTLEPSPNGSIEGNLKLFFQELH